MMTLEDSQPKPRQKANDANDANDTIHLGGNQGSFHKYRYDTKQPNLLGIRRNVFSVILLLGLIIYSLVSNSYVNMLAYVPESQSVPKTTDAPVILQREPAPVYTYACPEPEGGPGQKMVVFAKAIHTLSQLNCPYNIHAGTLLNFARDCELNDSDIDLVIPLVWMQSNEKALKAAMEAIGFRQWRTFGNKAEFGYETAYMYNGTKVDMFTTAESANSYEWALWLGGKPHRCTVNRTAVQEFQWGNITLRAPVPFDMALRSFYGKAWRKPFPGKWHWFESAVTVGSCEASAK
jgi:hypothetical protein